MRCRRRSAARPAPAALKPGEQIVLAVDAAAEAVGLAHLERLSAEIGCPIALVADAARGTLLTVGAGGGDGERVYAMLDAVDGTIKVGGLGNPADGSAVRLANDGGWGVGFACTAPTRAAARRAAARRLRGGGDRRRQPDPGARPSARGRRPPRRRRARRLRHVRPAGRARRPAPARRASSPRPRPPWRRRSSTSTASRPSTAQSALPGDEALIVELYRRLINRHEGGAFDVWRQYGNLSALLRMLLGWRGARPWIESQGGAFVVVNENLANLVPAVPLILGAGGCSVDFAGRPLAARRLAEGRTSVIHAANDVLRDRLLAIVADAAGASSDAAV